MKLYLERVKKGTNYTLGKLYLIEGDRKIFLMSTLEDEDRGLNKSMTLEQISKIKVMHETAIPEGTYEIDMNTRSPRFSNFSKYRMYKEYDGKLPRLKNVPGFSGVLIHIGNTIYNTSGCILVGTNNDFKSAKLHNSTLAFNKLMREYLLKAKDKITITIKNKYTE